MNKSVSEKELQKDTVGIVTLYHNNYNFGGLLQAYALPTAVKKYLGISAEQIDYIFAPDKEPKTEKPKKTVSVGSFINRVGFLFLNRLEKNNFNKRKKAFEQFMKDIPHSDRTYKAENINESLEKYNTFVCGGDQIWIDCVQMPWFSYADSKTFTLQFVPEQVKKIAYAPSMAVLELTDEFKNGFCIGINRLDAISVREKKSLPVLKTMTDKPITVAVDPVLLLKESDWLEAVNYSQKKGRYILCYLLGDSIEQRKAVTKLAKKINCKIITFPHILGNVVRKCDLFFGDIHDYTSGPREFVGLIKNAELVITDSFHACVFSMIFKTPFAIFERDKIGEKVNMNSRIYDFLEEYHLGNQLVTEQELTGMKGIPKIDFNFAHGHWKQRREESLEYLKNALENG